LTAKNYSPIIQQAHEKAVKSNDHIYHERVPDYKLLPGIERAALARITPIKFPLSEDFRDLFANMVPLSVYSGLQTFNAKRLEAGNLEIGKLRQATDLLNG
jgi:programmed cell death 6-interacting protein